MSDKKMEVSVVARRLNVSVSTIYRLIDAKELDSVRMGLRAGIRVPESSIACFEKLRKSTQ